MAQILKGETFTDVSPGKSVTSTRLNNHVDNATLLPGAVTEQTDISTALAADDTLLMHDTSASLLKKVQAQNLLVPEAITGRTDISTSLAAADLLLMADASASNALMKVQAQNLLVPEVITAKTDLTSAVAQDDILLISDTSASGALKRTNVSGLFQSGYQMQSVSTSDGGVTTTSSSIPVDNTIPQSGEGVQVLSQAITPISASNVLEIEAFVPIANSTSGAQSVIALFQDSGADALMATVVSPGATLQSVLHLVHRMTAGTTSATTFKIRLGTTAGSLYVNGDGTGTRNFGGVSKARLTIREIKV